MLNIKEFASTETSWITIIPIGMMNNQSIKQ